MAIGLLLEIGQETDPEIMGLVVHLPGKGAGFAGSLTMTCGEIDLIMQMMNTGGGTNLTGQCQWIGVIMTMEGIAFSMKGKGLRDNHPLHLYLRLHFLNVGDGAVKGETGADRQLAPPKEFIICTWSRGGEMISIVLGEAE